MTTITLLLDLTIVTSLLLLAWQALFRPALVAGVMYFIAFSLVVALAWGRLNAPDVALAEAAIGAGLTGALLLAAVRSMESAVAQGATEEVIHDET